MKKVRSAPEWMQPEQASMWEAAFGSLSSKKSKKQSPANKLTDAIMSYVKLQKCAAARINTTGIYDESIGKYRFSGSTKGVEDISCVLPININNHKIGIAIAIEIKIGKDRMSEHQKQRQENVVSAGGHYIVAKTFDDFKIEFDNIVAHYKHLFEKTPGI
jgi:hypothetical protein